jgi:hypothetical protein
MARMLERLPDELLLEVFSHLLPLRKEYNGVDHFFDLGSVSAYQPLTSLCLTSKRLSVVVTPLLYTDIIVSQKRNQYQISLLLRTILHNPVRGQQMKHIEHKLMSIHGWPCRDECRYMQHYKSLAWAEHRKNLQSMALKLWSNEKHKVQESLLDVYPDLAQLIILLGHAPNITQISTDMLADMFPWCLDLLGTEICGQNPPLGKYGLLHLERICFYTIEDWYSMGMLDSSPRTLDDFYYFPPELSSLRHYTHTTVCQRIHTPPAPPSDYHLHKVEILEFKQVTEATGVINSMIQACNKLKTFQLILEKIGDHISFDSLYNALMTRRQTLEHIKLWGVLDLLPSMVPLGGAFTHFTNLRSLEVDDMVLMGIPDDLNPQNLHEGWYFWTNVKPRRRLASMMPPTLESL